MQLSSIFKKVAIVAIALNISIGLSACSNDDDEGFHLVVFDSRGGSCVENQWVKVNSKITEPSAPTRSGHYFDGWFMSETGIHRGRQWNFASDVVTDNLILFARWTAR